VVERREDGALDALCQVGKACRAGRARDPPSRHAALWSALVGSASSRPERCKGIDRTPTAAADCVTEDATPVRTDAAGDAGCPSSRWRGRAKRAKARFAEVTGRCSFVIAVS
jgi:hypothetical protein